MTTNRVKRIFNDIMVLGLLEDKREYDTDDLQRMYGTTQAEAEDLYALIQNETVYIKPAVWVAPAGYWTQVRPIDILIFFTTAIGFVAFLWLAKIWPFIN
jgi:hypothetical protein